MGEVFAVVAILALLKLAVSVVAFVFGAKLIFPKVWATFFSPTKVYSLCIRRDAVMADGEAQSVDRAVHLFTDFDELCSRIAAGEFAKFIEHPDHYYVVSEFNLDPADQGDVGTWPKLVAAFDREGRLRPV